MLFYCYRFFFEVYLMVVGWVIVFESVLSCVIGIWFISFLDVVLIVDFVGEIVSIGVVDM